MMRRPFAFSCTLTEQAFCRPFCATGEEAYSLGMLLAERAVTLQNAPDFRVFASDID